MSRAVAAPQPPAPAPAPSARLRIGRVGDAAEIHADRAADRALAGGSPASPFAAGASGGVAAPAALERRIASAAPEGQPLSARQQRFFGGRFGHDFRRVRIHDGPASAAAARTAGAEALTLGQNVYFGFGRYRPDSASGEALLAHELAHTMQQRAGFIARRALAPALVDPDDAAPASIPQAEAAAEGLVDLARAGIDIGAPIARDRLAGLPPAERREALARTRARLPAGEAGKLGARTPPVAETTEAPGSAPPLAVRTRTARAAPVARETDMPDPAPSTHDRAMASAAARMDAAVRTAGEGGASGAGGAAPSPSGDSADADTGGDRSAQAATATQAALGRLGASRTALEAVETLPVTFLRDADRPPDDPEAATRLNAAESLARGFVGRTVEKVQRLLDGAFAVPGKVLGAFNAAAQAMRAQAVAQGAVLNAGAQSARKAIGGHAATVRGAMGADRAKADAAAVDGAKGAKARAGVAHGLAAGGLGVRALKEQIRIGAAYRDAQAPMKDVGDTAANKAAIVAGYRSDQLLAERDGESSVVDGPLHDNRLEADAEAGIKVAAEYGKSFQTSAADEAAKIPDSRGEVLGKVAEITREARKGFDDQLVEIDRGATAEEKGAKDRSAKAAWQMRAALDVSARQSLAGLDDAAAEQAAGLAHGAAAAGSGLDQAIAGSVTSFADGIGQAADGLTQSIRGFIGSAAETPPPEAGDLSAALADAAPDAALADMAAQAETVAPALTASAAEAQQANDATASRGAAAAIQGFNGQAKTFAEGATGVRRQSTVGFGALSKSVKTSTDETGKAAEDGFKEAAANADMAYTQCGDQVDQTFVKGRAQMLDGLWSRESRAKLLHDMNKYGREAADHVQPRWKKVLKWVVTIVVIVAVIAITVVSAGTLGPVGVVLLGAALGAAAGAVQTIADNIIDGKPWKEGVVKAMIVGAIGGAVGGAGGVLLKGVGSVALKIGLEAGINVVGGVAGEAIGSVAVGEPINWTGALMGALMGAGIGAGLGIAGALKGKIRLGAIGEAPPRPPAIEPPPAPAKGVRGALERAKILAPRPASTAPPPVKAPEPPTVPEPPAPRRRIGFRMGDAQDTIADAAPGTKSPIGFSSGEGPAPAAPDVAPAGPKEPIGFRTGEPATAPSADPANVREQVPSKPRRPIGFEMGDRAQPPSPDKAVTQEPSLPGRKKPIGFDLGDRSKAPSVDLAAAAPGPKAPIGFRTGASPDVPTPASSTTSPAPAAAPELGAVDLTGARPKAMSVEPPAARTGGGGPEPIPAGGRSRLETRASTAPRDGGGRPKVGHVEVAEPPTPGPGAAETAKPSTGREAPTSTPEAPQAKPKRRIIVGRDTAAGTGAEPKAASVQPEPATQSSSSVAKRESLNEPRRPQTGDEFEAAELLSDTSRPPKSGNYFDYQGGKRGSFFQFAKQFKAHLKGVGRSGSVPINEAPLKMSTGEFISSRPSLRPRWMSMMADVTAEIEAYRKNNPNYSRSDYYQELEAQLQELNSFGKGTVGRKRPDLVELFPNEGRAEVTDISKNVGSRFHAFKTQFYTDLIDAMFPTLDALGNEYNGPLNQRWMGPT